MNTTYRVAAAHLLHAVYGWYPASMALPGHGQMVDWVNEDGDEVLGGRYVHPLYWMLPTLMPATTNRRVIAWRPTCRE